MLGSISHLVFHDFVEVLRRKMEGRICYYQKTNVDWVACVHTTPGGSEQAGDANSFNQCRVSILSQLRNERHVFVFDLFW